MLNIYKSASVNQNTGEHSLPADSLAPGRYRISVEYTFNDAQRRMTKLGDDSAFHNEPHTYRVWDEFDLRGSFK